MKQIKVFATTGSGYLADGICNFLKGRLPGGYLVERAEHIVDTFSNENIQVTAPNVRGSFCVIIHTQTPPVSNNLLELFALMDAICNSEAENVLLVFPYMPWSRSDRKNKPRISTMSVWLAHTINRVCGVKKVLLVEPHDGHIKHYFEPTAQEVSTMYLLASYLKDNYLKTREQHQISKIVYPDAGAAKRYGDIARMLGLKTAYIDKDREDNKENPRLKGIVGNVEGNVCFLVDDEVLTANTTIGDAEKLLECGAKEVNMVVTHPILSKKGSSPDQVAKNLNNSPISKIIFTNSIPTEDKIEGMDKFTVIPIEPLLSEATARIILMQSISELHTMESIRGLRLL